jgi:competence protein ComEC
LTARALAALAGALFALLCPAAATGPVLWAGLAAGAAALLRGWLVAACFLLMACWTEHAILAQLAGQPPADERVLARVRIASLPASQPTSQGVGIEFDGEALLERRPEQPRLRVRITWRRPPVPRPRAGETWQLALQLRAARGAANPGAVDERRILWRDHIHARATVIDGALDRRVAPSTSFWLSARERVADRILFAVADPAAAGLLAALAVGYTGDIGREQWRIYNATGITHLIAISGLHVTLFAALAMAALRRLWERWPRIGAGLRRESFAAAGGVVCAAAYALLAGYSVPTQRTLLMLIVALAWRHCARAAAPASALAAALLLVLASDPFAVLAAGFWLSFGAVAVILWREGARLGAPAGLGAGLRLQLVITLALAPATLANFGSLSVAGLWVNLLAIPLFSFVLVPLVLLASALVLLAVPDVLVVVPLWLADHVATPTGAGLATAAATPLALWQVAPARWWHAFGLVGVLLIVLPLGLRLRLLALGTALALACGPARPERGGVRLLALSAGPVPVVLLSTSRHDLLFGTGDRYGTRGARVVNLVQPAAVTLDVARLDLVIAGPLDRDVAAGLGAVQAVLPATRLAAARRPGAELPPRVSDCARLGAWRWDEVEFSSTAIAGERGCRLTVRTRDDEVVLQAAQTLATPAAAVLLDVPARGVANRRILRPRLGVWRGP